MASLIGQWGIIPRFRVSPKSLVVWGAVLSAVGCIGVVLAHDRTVALVPRPRAVRAQLPVLALMVFFTLAGLTLLFAA